MSITRPRPEPSAMAAGAPAPFQLSAVVAILHREWRVFRRVWLSMTFGSIVEPIIFFLAFGYGLGALVAEVAGLSYLEFMATGTVGVGILFSAMFPGLINGYFRRKEQHLYDGVLAAPVSVPELVTGEALWNGLRVTVVAVATLLVAVAFGIGFGSGVVLIPLISIVAGFGFAAAGAAGAAVLRSTHGFDFIIVGIITPMFVVAGTFFPIGGLPPWAVTVAHANPLYHTVELVRSAAFGLGSPASAFGHLTAVLVFDALAWLAAVALLRRALVD